MHTYKGIYKMIFVKQIIAITFLTASINLAMAANIDFNVINNSMADCDCTNQNESSLQCEAAKSKNIPSSNDVKNDKPCTNVKIEKSYVEPKFSTARPRGQY